METLFGRIKVELHHIDIIESEMVSSIPLFDFDHEFPDNEDETWDEFMSKILKRVTDISGEKLEEGLKRNPLNDRFSSLSLKLCEVKVSDRHYYTTNVNVWFDFFCPQPLEKVS